MVDESSAQVVTALRAGNDPYDQTDPRNTTDALNERTHREHIGDYADQARQAFGEWFRSLVKALEPLTEEELFGSVISHGLEARRSWE